MAASILIHEDVSQLLLEAGCTNEFTQQFLTAMETESFKSQLLLLRGQRSHQRISRKPAPRLPGQMYRRTPYPKMPANRPQLKRLPL